MSGSVSISKVSAGRGMAWISEGIDLFRQAPGVWIGMVVFWTVISIAAAAIPVLGDLFGVLCYAMISGGYLYAAHGQSEGHPPQLGMMFNGFKAPYWKRLLLLGFAFLGLIVVMVLAMFLLFFLAFGSGALSGNLKDFSPGIGTGFAVLLLLALIAAVSMAAWFTAPLVMFRSTGIIESFRVSFDACLRNLGALGVYGLVWIGVSLVLMIPIFISLAGENPSFVTAGVVGVITVLVVMPVFVTSSYRAYRDICGATVE